MNNQWAMPIQVFCSDSSCDGDHVDSLRKAFWDYHSNVRRVESTIKVLQSTGPWADHFVSELAPVVQAPLVYLCIDSLQLLESLNAVAEHLEEKIKVLGSFGGGWAEELIGCLRRFRTFIEDRIKVVLKVLGIPIFLQETLVKETDFFEYHGCGRPPRTLDRALKAGLSIVTGRMRSSPAFV